MPDTIRNEAALQALLADNTAGDISAQDIRDFLVSVPTLAITAGNASSQRTALGLVIGTDVAAQSSLASYLPLAGGTMTGTITSTLGTLAGSSTPAFSSTATFNNAATTFSHFLLSVTNTASNAASRVFDVQIGGTSRVSVKVDGTIEGATDSNLFGANTVKLASIRTGEQIALGSAAVSVLVNASNQGIILGSGRRVCWASSSGEVNASTLVSNIDVSVARNAAGVIEVNNGTAGTFRDLRARNVRTEPVVVASLVAAATAGKGARCFVTDANATTYASVVAGGGANNVPVYSDGTNWLIG